MTTTPGPWHVLDMRSEGLERLTIAAASAEHETSGASVIARVENKVSKKPINAIDEANARLIAAAPDLLEALKQVLPYVPGFNEGDAEGRPWLTVALRAVERAQGAIGE